VTCSAVQWNAGSGHQAGRQADSPEGAPNVGSVQFRADSAAEHQAVLVPVRAGMVPLDGLALPVGFESLEGALA